MAELIARIDVAEVVGFLQTKVCSASWRRGLLTGFFRFWMAHHFSNLDNIESEELKRDGILWDRSDDTKILIEDVSLFKPSLTQLRPAILIRPDAQQYQKLYINNQIVGDNYGGVWQGSHTIFCISNLPHQVEILAAEVARELLEFSVILRGPLGLNRLQIAEIGARGLLEESSQNWAVPITMGYVYPETWTVTPEDGVLEGVDFQLLNDLGNSIV